MLPSVRTRLESHIIEGNVFRSQVFVDIPANSSTRYNVFIPSDVVITTLGRNWTTEFANVELVVYVGATGIVLGTQYPNFNNNGRSTKTTSVALKAVTSFTTKGTAVDTAHIHGSNKTTGGEYPNSTFRVYAPGNYLAELVNLNNAACEMLVEYQWIQTNSLEDV